MSKTESSDDRRAREGSLAEFVHDQFYKPFYEDYVKGIELGVRSVVWDNALDVWEYIRLSVYGREATNRDDLKTEAPVDLYTLILGGEAMVKTLNGQVSMKVPPETQPGRIIRLRGQGMPNLRDPKQRGDLYVKVQAHLPQHLSSEEKKLFEQLAKLRK